MPVLGDVEADAVSLPAFTVAVAGLDAFNPCAFFVLLFLLSLLVHARSRWRMALVGGVFVLISGVMYFAFMAAWPNVFLETGQLRWVTTVAGAIAITLAVLSIKDYFWPDSSGSLSIPDSAKPGLFSRMRGLTMSETEGRFLKLMLGAMMLGLGLLPLWKPALLETMFAAIGIMAVALVIAVLVSLAGRHRDQATGAA